MGFISWIIWNCWYFTYFDFKTTISYGLIQYISTKRQGSEHVLELHSSGWTICWDAHWGQAGIERLQLRMPWGIAQRIVTCIFYGNLFKLDLIVETSHDSCVPCHRIILVSSFPAFRQSMKKKLLKTVYPALISISWSSEQAKYFMVLPKWAQTVLCLLHKKWIMLPHYWSCWPL